MGYVRRELLSTPVVAWCERRLVRRQIWAVIGAGTLGRADRWGVGKVFAALGAPDGVGASVGCRRLWELRYEQEEFSRLLKASLENEAAAFHVVEREFEWWSQ